MARNYFDRYGQFKLRGEFTTVPFITLSSKGTDLKAVYDNTKRLDKLSYEYYGSAYYGWLILLANPKYGGLEFNIPNKTVITIPFPLMDSLQDYQEKINRHITLYGNE